MTKKLKECKEPLENIFRFGYIIPDQVEGIHYKLLFSGSKMFWRTQKTVTLDFYHHILSRVVEIIVFDPAINRECNRLYLNYPMIYSSNTVQSGLDEAVEEEVLKRDSYNQRFDRVIIREEIIGPRIINFILSRLSQDKRATIGFASLINDTHTPLLQDGAPSTLVPLKLTRRRHTTGQDFERSTVALKRDTALLRQARQYAEVASGLVKKGVTVMKQQVQEHRLRHTRDSSAKQRWVWAIRKVIGMRRKERMIQLLKQQGRGWKRSINDNNKLGEASSSNNLGSTLPSEFLLSPLQSALPLIPLQMMNRPSTTMSVVGGNYGEMATSVRM